MLNKILIEMIIKQLLKDVFNSTFIKYQYNITNNKIDYEITIFASLKENRRTLSKHIKFSIENWVELITDYKYRKEYLQKDLIDNLKEDY